jgi:hypothetical protein
VALLVSIVVWAEEGQGLCPWPSFPHTILLVTRFELGFMLLRLTHADSFSHAEPVAAMIAQRPKQQAAACNRRTVPW